MNHVTEVVLFRLKADVDLAQFLKDAQATFDLIESYDGYLTRELSVSEDGQWVDIVTWRDLESAFKAAEQFMTHPLGQALGDHLDPASVQMLHTVPRISTLQTT